MDKENLNITKVVLILAMLTNASQMLAQNYQARYKVYLHNGIKVNRKDEYLSDTLISKPYIFNRVHNLKNKEGAYTVTEFDTVLTPVRESVYKTLVTKDAAVPAWANLKTDEKDQSIIHVNYWLQPKHAITLNMTVDEVIIKIDPTGNRMPPALKKLSLSEDTVIRGWKYSPKVNSSVETIARLLEKTTHYYIVYEANTSNIDYYIFDLQDDGQSYSFKLNNRSFISLYYTTWEFGALVIPFKYRPGFKHKKVSVSDQWVADVNINSFFGHTWGRFRQRLEGKEIKNLSKLSITTGGIVGLGSTTLDSDNTKAGNAPFEKDRKVVIGTFTLGVGVTASIYDFNLGLYSGFDFGIGQETSNWNYNGKPWIGIGLGYDIPRNFWKKSL